MLMASQNSAFEPVRVLVRNFDIAPFDGVLSMLGVLYYRGGGASSLLRTN